MHASPSPENLNRTVPQRVKERKGIGCWAALRLCRKRDGLGAPGLVTLQLCILWASEGVPQELVFWPWFEQKVCDLNGGNLLRAGRLGWPARQVRSLAADLVEGLSGMGRYVDAAAVSAGYLDDAEGAVALFCQAHEWREVSARSLHAVHVPACVLLTSTHTSSGNGDAEKCWI